MSHNKITVASQSPSSSGDISLGLNNLSNVSIGTLNLNDVLKYDGSNVVNGSSPASSLNYLLIGQGETNAYSNSGASSIGAGDTLRIYDTSPINTISGASLTKYSSTDWIESFTLPAGNYQVISQFNVSFSLSGYASVSIEDGSDNSYTHRVVIGDNADSLQAGAATSLVGYFELSSTTTLHLELKAVSNLVIAANQGDTISEQTFVLIIKLS
tara:strand:+ start:245 stop:883 length:639 start_codon:yes stop_codon:yes gene_type:complete